MNLQRTRKTMSYFIAILHLTIRTFNYIVSSISTVFFLLYFEKKKRNKKYEERKMSK